MRLSPHPRGWATELGSQEVHFGSGCLENLGTVTARVGRQGGEEAAGKRVLVVTDPGIEDAGHVDVALASLRKAGLEPEVFDGVDENPTTEHVAAGVAAAAAFDAEIIVGLGGGSAMDCAKGINFLYTNGGEMEDYWGFGKAEKPMLPAVGVPTTAGTGSEGQSFALISQAAGHRKMACGDPKARFRAVLLDPELLTTAPRDVTAVTGYDAISHAVESYVSGARNPLSQIFAKEAWRYLSRAYEKILVSRSDARAREDMLLGAYLAGNSIELSMLGAAHSCANPLTARFGIIHGDAVGLMLPAVVRYNGQAVDALYGELLAASGHTGNGGGNGSGGVSGSVSGSGEALSRRLEELRSAAGRPSRLGDLGIGAGDLSALAAEAAEQWTARFNPRPVAEADLLKLYEEVL